jgi:2-enoate reductase
MACGEKTLTDKVSEEHRGEKTLKYEKLFEPVQIGKVAIKNRIAMAPMGNLWPGFVDPDGSLTQRVIDYYVERAAGGCGLIITGINRATNLEPIACPYVSQNTQPSFSELAEQVHYYGTRIFAQLTAGWGRVLYTVWGDKPFSASEVPAYWQPETITRALSLEEIKEIISSLGKAAKILKDAGIDGVELHGHEGYLIDQFSTAIWNKRSDQYGGRLENRLRFAIEILNSIKEKAGDDFPVTFRFGLKHYIKGLGSGALKEEDFVEAGRDIPEGLEMAKMLEKAGFDASHVDAGCYDAWYWSHPTTYQPHGSLVEMAEMVKKVVNIPVIAVGRLDIPELAEKTIKDGKADLIAIGRGLLADPQWPKKVHQGKVEDIRPCYACWDGCLSRGVNEHKPQSCSVNPAAGRERLYTLRRVDQPATVLVIGGGIAGMEAAWVSAMRGCKVVLHEKTNELGGHLLAASVPVFKQDLRRLIVWYRLQLEKLGVDIKYNLETTPEQVRQVKAEKVIIATGSIPVIPNIPGTGKPNVATCEELLLGKKSSGQKVVLIGGGLVGCETALWLAQQGKSVTVVEVLPEVATAIFRPSRTMLLDILKAKKAKILTGTCAEEIRENGVIVRGQHSSQTLECDTVALATGLKSQRNLYDSLKNDITEIYVIGDSKEPRKIINAIWDAFHIASR